LWTGVYSSLRGGHAAPESEFVSIRMVHLAEL
jgi:hypothetical protein